MSVKDYALDPDLNTDISGISIAEGCPPSGINDAIRQLMADVKEESEAQGKARDLAREQAVEQAGNNAASDAAARVSALDAELRAFVAQEVAKYLPLTGGTLSGALAMGDTGKVLANEEAGWIGVGAERSGVSGAGLFLRTADAPTRPGHVLLLGRNEDGSEGAPVWVTPEGSVEAGGGASFAGNVSAGGLLRGNDASTLIIGPGADYNTSPSVILFGSKRSGDNLGGRASMRAVSPAGAQVELVIYPEGYASLAGSRMVTAKEFVAYQINKNGAVRYLPAGGTWQVVRIQRSDGYSLVDLVAFQAAGGSAVNVANSNTQVVLAWRIA